MIQVGVVVELLEEYSVAMTRLREQFLVPRRMLRMDALFFLRSLRSASTSPITAQGSSAFFVYF